MSAAANPSVNWTPNVRLKITYSAERLLQTQPSPVGWAHAVCAHAEQFGNANGGQNRLPTLHLALFTILTSRLSNDVYCYVTLSTRGYS
jgi:hypothetical protein